MPDTQIIATTQQPRRARARRSARQEIATKPVMLLVLGMHRSGTSVCARMLECLGAANSTNLNPPNFANTKGYFEDWDIYQFNDNVLLPRLGLQWNSTAPVDWSLLGDSDRSRLAMRAVQIVRTNYPPGRSLAVLKEPRIGILLPFWLSVLAHAGYEVRVVCAVRDPVSVARSLQARDKLSTAYSSLLFLSYWLSILNHLRVFPVAFVQFDEIFTEPRKVLEKVALKLHLPLPADFSDRVADFTSEFLDRGLRHHRYEMRDLDLDPDVPPLTLDLYRHLVRAAQAQNLTPLLKFAAAKEKELAQLQPVFVEFDRVHLAYWTEQNEARALREKVSALEKETEQRVVQAAAKDRGSLAARITQLEAANAQLEAERSDLATRHSSLVTEREALQSENSSLVTRHSSLVAERDNLSAQYASVVDESKSLRSEKDELSARLSSLQFEHSSLVTSHNDLTARLSSLEDERDTLSAATAAEREAKTKVEEQLNDVTEENELLLGQLHQVQEELEKYFLENQALKQESDRAQSLTADHSDLVTRHTSLVTEREALQSEHSSLVTRHSSLVAERDNLVAETEALKTNVADRFRELAELTKRLTKAEDENRKLTEELSSLVAERDQLSTRHTSLVTEREALQSEHSSLVTRHSSLVAERDGLVAETKALNTNIADRFRELAELTKRVIVSEAKLKRAYRERRELTQLPAWKAAAPLRALLAPFAKQPRPTKAQRAQVAMIRKSGLFDESYYLLTYSDVAAAGVSPVLHYVQHGAKEGRNPSASFDTAAYARQHAPSKSLAENFNPLCHFIQSRGKKS